MEDYIVSSGNIFEDMGFADAEERLAKAKLAVIINKIIEERKLSPKESAKIFGIKQAQVSDLKNGRLTEFSIELLFYFLEALDQHIEITITHKSKAKQGHGIQVAYV
ncbi:MAG: XRE family transcriptional regulator [Candidatus Aminicenantes bacterium]|nr:XRE family transcriptional regulator [Candidatus Aminicenantes bacterium]